MKSFGRHRVALVGLGPKGLFALERLAFEASRTGTEFDVEIFEPHPWIGAGPVYDPEQPPFLRMNFASKHIDVWDPALEGGRAVGGGVGADGEGGCAVDGGVEIDGDGGRAVDGGAGMNGSGRATGGGRAGPSLVEWSKRSPGPALDPEDYAPRARVGEYLHGQARRVLAQLRRTSAVRVHRRRVTSVSRTAAGWVVRADAGPPAEVDDVLIATGHSSRSTEPHGTVEATSSVYPVTRELSCERIRPGSAVAIRGFGLTALDAVVTLRHRPVADRPGRLVVYSRTGRPMLPKLCPSAALPPECDAVFERGRGAIPHARSTKALARIVVDTASELLAALGGHRHAPAAELHVLMDCGAGYQHPLVPETALRRGVAIARGDRDWNAERALGEAWRALYPSVVQWHARTPLNRAARRCFQRLCVELERLAFGPPLAVAEELLEGVDEGWVDLSLATGPEVAPSPGGWTVAVAGVRRTVGHLVDAVLAGPGVTPHPSRLFRSLLDSGHVRAKAGWRGVEVTPHATAVGANGTPTEGLAVVGRPTEGAVLGNDTLSRTLHGHPRAWARHLVERARADRMRAS